MRDLEQLSSGPHHVPALPASVERKAQIHKPNFVPNCSRALKGDQEKPLGVIIYYDWCYNAGLQVLKAC